LKQNINQQNVTKIEISTAEWDIKAHVNKDVKSRKSLYRGLQKGSKALENLHQE
jgi:hypothetical protein